MLNVEVPSSTTTRPQAQLHEDLLRFDAQATVMVEKARRWLESARTKREKDFANALLRHARGIQVATGAGRQELNNT